MLDKFSLIFFNKTLFFLPPPQIRTSFMFCSELVIEEVNSCPITLAVKSVRVVAPSSVDNPRANEISKSLVSKDLFSLLSLLE